MEQKKRFYLKNDIVGVIIAIGIAMLSLFCFVVPAIDDMKKYDNAMSVLEETLYDYRLPSPLPSQVNDLEKLESVASVFPYYCYKGSVLGNGKNYDTNIIFSDVPENITISAYNEERLISGSMFLDKDYILMDKDCADALGLDCGDMVNIKLSKTSEIPVTIAGIFKNNSFFEKGSIYLDYSGGVKERIMESYEELNLAGVLIKEDNISCWNDIKTYIPMGEMLSEDYFANSREYNEYVKNFMSEDYSSRIYNKKELLKSEKSINQRYIESADKNIMLGCVTYGIVFVLLFLQVLVAKRFVINFAKNNNSQIATNELIEKYIKKDILSAICGFFIFIVIFNLISQKSFISGGFNNKVIQYFGSAGLVSLLILIAIDIIVIKKSIHKGNEYR